MDKLQLPLGARPGLARPSSDFQAVRDKRRAPLFYVDVDLSTARNIAAGTALVLTFAGNFLYVDQRQNTGYAGVYFTDDNPRATPVTIFAGALWKVPFTQVTIENVAQPGQSMRLVYGVDVDALPISAAGVTVLNAVNINDQIASNCQILQYAANDPVGTNVNAMLAAATNVSGVLVRSAYLSLNAGAGAALDVAIIAAATAPAGLGAKTSAVILIENRMNSATPNFFQHPPMYRRIPAGWGIWCVSVVTVAASGVDAKLSLEVL